MGIKIDCKIIADNIIEKAKNDLNGNNGIVTILQWGENKASDKYVKNKIKRIKKVGLRHNHIYIDDNYDESYVAMEIMKANIDDNVVGLMLQLPIPLKYRNNGLEHKLLNMIDSSKDLDCLTDHWKLNLYNGSNKLLPCTVQGCLDILKDYYKDELEGKNVAILGRSDIVGKPLIHALLNENCTPICIHSKSVNIYKLIRNVDVIISATGNMDLLSKANLMGKVVIDVGINFDSKGKLRGDISEYDKEVYSKAYTSVPNGVAQLTLANVIFNISKLIQMKSK